LEHKDDYIIRVITKSILGKEFVVMWIGFNWLRIQRLEASLTQHTSAYLSADVI